METSRIEQVALLAAVIAGALALTAARGDFGYISSIGGLTLLSILFAYDQQGYRTPFQSLAFSAVCGLCLLLIAGFGFQLFLSQTPEPSPRGFYEKWLSLTWLLATALFCTVDRVRMSTRESLSLRPPAREVFTPASGAYSQRTYTPAEPIQPAPVPVPVPPPPPVAVPAYPVPPPASFSAVAIPPSPAPAPPNAVPLPAGKATMIYVNLVGEGLNVLRSVQAEHLGRDFYRIADVMPEGERWEFQPGQVVRCKKKNLSSGKGLVAFEEAPRAS